MWRSRKPLYVQTYRGFESLSLRQDTVCGHRYLESSIGTGVGNTLQYIDSELMLFVLREPNGQGTMTLADGGKYVGEFRDGKLHGQGTMTRPDGGKHEGVFRDGFFLGKGWKGR
jgi:hypothetical protein